jgi:hypothetical protein
MTIAARPVPASRALQCHFIRDRFFDERFAIGRAVVYDRADG